MRRAARIDDNQNEIVKKLRDIGCSVAITSAVGRGFPDIVVGFKGFNYLIEIKDGKKPPSQRKLTSDEQAWHDQWRGSVHIVESFDDCLAILGK
jgi:Holliday junction resolvase